MSDDKEIVTTLDQSHADPDFADTELADTSAYADTPMDPREQLRQKIEAGKQRLAERDFGNAAKDAADGAVAFTREHPLAVIAGAIGVGVLIGAMTRPGRKVAKTASKRTGAFAALATEAALAFGLELLERAEENAAKAKQKSSDALADFGDSVSDATRDLKRDATYQAEVAADTVKSASRKATRKTSRNVRNLRAKIRR